SGAKAAPVPAHLVATALERVASGAAQAKAAAWGPAALLGSTGVRAVVVTTVMLTAATTSVLVLKPPRRPVPNATAPPPLVLNGVGMGMRLVPAGTFQMGTPENEGLPFPMDLGAERPVHAVTLTHPFRISETEVTRGQFRTVMGRDPSGFQPSEGSV